MVFDRAQAVWPLQSTNSPHHGEMPKKYTIPEQNQCKFDPKNSYLSVREPKQHGVQTELSSHSDPSPAPRSLKVNNFAFFD